LALRQDDHFLVNPDQLAPWPFGAQYHSAPDDPTPVIGALRVWLLAASAFRNLDITQASIGATDIAMRQHLPPTC